MKPTKARIELMQAISDGAVTERYAIGFGWLSSWDRGPDWSAGRRYQRVTGRTTELRRETLISVEANVFSHTPRPWGLTPAGEAWLKANGGSTP